MKERAIQQANSVVEDYSMRELDTAYKAVEKSRSGLGCNCGSCKNSKVSEINSWLDFLDGDVINSCGVRYGFDAQGNVIHIMTGYEDTQPPLLTNGNDEP